MKNTYLFYIALGYSRKKTHIGGWGYGISRGIKVIASGICRGNLKKSCGISWSLGFRP